MDESEHLRVALLLGDRVIDATDDLVAVRTCAALMAGARRDPETTVFVPITDGRRTACRLVALGAA